MVEDKFVQEIKDKMNYGVSRLSPIAHDLYFSLEGAFLSLGRKKEIKMSLVNLSENLGIENKKQSELKSIIKDAFNQIHENTFVKYKFSFKWDQNDNQIKLYISAIDNSAEIKALFERMAIKKSDMV